MSILSLLIQFFKSPTHYEPFNNWYFSALSVLLLLCIAICLTPNNLRQHRLYRWAVATPAFIAVCSSCYRYRVIPLHLCHITGVLVIPLALILQRRLFQYCLIYVSGWAALVALLTPNLALHTSMIRYLIFFTIHGYIVLATLYAYCVYQLPITLRSFINVLAIFNVYLVLVGVIDYVTHNNYIYLKTPPDSVPGLFHWPWYIGETEVFLIGLSLLTYGCVRAIARYNLKQTTITQD